MIHVLPRGIFARVLIAVSTIALGACEAASITGEEEQPPLTAASLAGEYRLASLGSACDVMTSGVIKTGGTFTPRRVEGTLTFEEDGTVGHDFSIAGTCAFPDGTRSEIDQRLAYAGTYRVAGRQSVELNHGGVLCTATFKDGVLSVRTGSLFPPVRFTYTLEKSAGAPS